MKKSKEKRHIKEIIEDEETITVIYGKDEHFEGIKIADSDDPEDDDAEVIPESVEDSDMHDDEEDEMVEEEDEMDEDEEEDDVEENMDHLEDEEEEEEEEEVEESDMHEDEEDEEEIIDEDEDEIDDEEELEEDEEEDEEEEKNRSIWDKKDTTEKRFFTVETRLKKKGKRNIVEGHAVVFGQLSEDLGGFQERILPGAFDTVLGNDVRAFFNHDPNFILGRSSAGTLKLAVDKKGLKYSFDVPDTTAGRFISID